METKQLIDYCWSHFTGSAKSCRKFGAMSFKRLHRQPVPHSLGEAWVSEAEGLASWKLRVRRKCRTRSGNASTGSWLWFSKNKQTRAGEDSAIGQLLAPDGPWLIPMASSKGKHAGSNSWALSQWICIYGKNYGSKPGPHCDRMWSLTAP